MCNFANDFKNVFFLIFNGTFVGSRKMLIFF